jgi:nucleoside phosphorylase
MELETRAVLRHMPDRKTDHVTGTAFHRGVVEGWDVVVAEVGPGNASAAVIAERAIGHFGPAVALFVGVAGGIKDVAIGDVVVATKVYGYESGKETKEGFKVRPDLQVTAHAIEQQARAIRQSAAGSVSERRPGQCGGKILEALQFRPFRRRRPRPMRQKWQSAIAFRRPDQ